MKKTVLLSFLAILYLNAFATGAPDAGKKITPYMASVSVIFDTDLDSDVDDVGALAVLHALANNGDPPDQ